MSPLHGDESELFERYHQRLLRLTAFEIKTSPENIEEACAYAWAQLLVNEVRRDTAFAWLKQVARREAIRLHQLDRGAVPLGHEQGAVDPDRLEVPAGNPAVTPELWTEALSRLDRLPERDRRAVVMRAFGWKYTEIGEALGMSYTRVNAVLVRADGHLRELDERQAQTPAPRASRLLHLEADPPRWLRDAIGRRPARNRRRGDNAALIREWRRLALAIDDYRREYDVHDPHRALGPQATSRDQRVQRDELRSRIDRFGIERAQPPR
jgi:DNA-directed RNA polymerase specialized sigma24 family protein